MTNKQFKKKVLAVLNKKLKAKGISAWDRGVCSTAYDKFEWMDDDQLTTMNKWRGQYGVPSAFLDGAGSVSNYVYSGCGLCYDTQICNLVCTEEQKKKYNNGNLPPDQSSWLEVYIKVVAQAIRLLCNIVQDITEEHYDECLDSSGMF